MRAPRLRHSRLPNHQTQSLRPHRRQTWQRKQASPQQRKQHLTASPQRRCSHSAGRKPMPSARVRRQVQPRHSRIPSLQICNPHRLKPRRQHLRHLHRLRHNLQPRRLRPHPAVRHPISPPACHHGARSSARSSSHWGLRAFWDLSRSGISGEWTSLVATRPSRAATSGATRMKKRPRPLRPMTR